MNGKRFAVLLVVLLILLTVVPGTSAVGATLTVDGSCIDSEPNGSCDGLTDTYKTIQAAVTAASSGDIIDVLAGNYNESLTVTKSLSFTGPNAGTSGSGTRVAEATINGLFTIDTSNVSVDGFTFTNPGQLKAIIIDDATPSNTDIVFANNIVDAVGSFNSSDNVHSLYVERGGDNVTIEGNLFSNITGNLPDVEEPGGDSERSGVAVFIGDTASTDQSTGLLIQNNVFSTIHAGRGAYGILINNGAGTPEAEILNNSFNDIEGAWTHAVGMEGDTPNGVVSGNTFSSLAAAGVDKSGVFFEDNPSGGTVSVHGNLFNGSTFYGVAVHPTDLPGGANGLSYVVDAENNWWNDASGPSGEGPGSGAAVGPQVDYTPWWAAPDGSAISDGSGWTFDGGTYAGGFVVNENGLTINLNGSTVGPGSPAFIINADNVTIVGPGTLDGGGAASPAILVNAGADNFTLKGVEVTGWADGIEVAGSVTSFKLVENFIHDNTNAGLQINGGVAFGGIVTIEGNLFKDNGGNGIQNDSGANVAATYNSWGAIAGPAAGDGISADVTATPFTFAEIYMDVEPDNEVLTRNVVEGETFDVAIKAEAENLYGLAFLFTFDPNMVSIDPGTDVTFPSPWNGRCESTDATDAANGILAYRCNLISGAEWDGGTVATFSFTADLSGYPAGNGPWTNIFDISAQESDTSAAAIGGVKVFVNNAGFNAPSVVTRDITDANDGEVIITGAANYTGFVDLQGRTDDSGAVVEVYDQQVIAGSTELAQGGSNSSGEYTTAPLASYLLALGNTYWLQVDAPLYLPTTGRVSWASVSAATDWQHSALLDTRPVTTLGNVVLLGGDATDNNVVNIADASCIGASYQQPSGSWTCTGGTGASADVNGDGQINILDLVLAGGNYDLTFSTWTP